MNQKQLGLAIKKRRKYLRVTQKDLSEIVGIGLRTLVNIESGKGNATIGTLFQILNALGMQFEIKIKQVN